MKSIRRFLARLRTPRGEQRLREELEEHIALQTADNIRSGLPPAEARRQAILKFGPVEAVKDDYRDTRSLPFLETAAQDTRHAIRRLRKTPAFSIAAMLTLALGIGVTTSIFTLVHAVLLKSLPVSHPDQLYGAGKETHCCVWGGYTQNGEFSLFSYELYKHLRDSTPGFEEMAAFQAGGNFLGVRRAGSSNAAESIQGEFVSGNYFTMFGLSAYAGRVFSADDDRPSAPPVAMMSYRAWNEKYGMDPAVIGAVFHINGIPFTIIGVTPPGFYGDKLRSIPPDIYLPLNQEPLVKGASSLLQAASVHWLDIIGRVRPGTNVASLEARMRVELLQWQRSHWGEMTADVRDEAPKQKIFLSPGGAGIGGMRQDSEHLLHILAMVSGFALLIVCANLANLMLVRGMERRPQTSLSMALGARPGRLVQQALAECLLLSLAGGVLGIALAYGCTHLILYFLFPNATALPISATPSTAVLAFAFAISVLTGVAFGIAPAWLATRADPVEALRSSQRTTRGSGSVSRRALVAVQAAISLVLLSSAGLLVSALRSLEHQNFGFEQQDRFVVNVDPLLAGYKPEQLDLLYTRIRESFQTLPGVASAACAHYSPMSGDAWNDSVHVEGKPDPAPKADIGTSWARVSPGFLETIGNPVVRGRAIGERDTASAQRVAVINEAFARKFFKDEDPIGKHFGKGPVKHAGDYEVIGVAKDVRYLIYNLARPVGAFFFIAGPQVNHYDKAPDSSAEVRSQYMHDIVVRRRPGAVLTDTLARRALAAVDPNLPLMRLSTLGRQVANVFSQQRLIARLTSLFGVLSLVLASIGIYGVTAYNAGSRTNEIGIRVALGAERRNIVGLILRGALLLVALGLLIGIPLTFAAGRFLGEQLYGLNQNDPAILSTAVIVLALSALIAALVPAFRASSISPMQALRSE